MMAFLVSACGSGKSRDESIDYAIGFAPDYKAPDPNYNSPDVVDPSFRINEPEYSHPYWVGSLIMDNGDEIIDHIFSATEEPFFFSFPIEKPSYIPVSIIGWAPANDRMKDASKHIFEVLDTVIDMNFEEANDQTGDNVISISQSIQSNTAGFSYFPNTHYELGSDVFISKSFSDPVFVTNNLTNYDFEILVHEIGHALGLKHPFEEDGDNTEVLNVSEDQTKYTAMSYDDYSYTFDGTFRALDWMALTKLYGVNPSYEAQNNTYEFSRTEGVFIIDGGGHDTIICEDTIQSVYLDLRPGAHSYEGEKEVFITSARQLTISHGSDIENVKTGYGDDTIIGNDLSNIIETSEGDDTIFAGEGKDIINPGMGINSLDLSENISETDTLIINYDDINNQYNYVYGFTQGSMGDVIDFKNFQVDGFTFLPLVNSIDVPSGLINNCVIRVFGDRLTDSINVENSFNKGGILEKLNLSEGSLALLITSSSQGTGENQSMYVIDNKSGHIDVSQVSLFIGNYLDIDNWSQDNFIF